MESRKKRRKAPKNIVYICSTYYHVYIAIAKILLGAQHADIIICDDIDAHECLCSSLERSNVCGSVFFFDGKKVPTYDPKNKIEKVFIQHRKHQRMVESALPLDLNQYTSIFIFHDGTKLGKYLQDAKIPYHLLEDSLNYFQIIQNTPGQSELPPANKIKFLMKYYGGIGYLPCGQNRFCRSIEVNEKKNLQIGHRAILESPRAKMLSALDCEQRKRIFDVFVDTRIASFLKSFCANQKKSVLLLTNPLFFDQYVRTEQMQISIYKDIIDVYQGKGYTVIIKPHPRDQAEYHKYFPKLIILEKNFPTEVLNYDQGIFFDEAATIFSSSIEVLQCVGTIKRYGFSFLNNYAQYLTQSEKTRQLTAEQRGDGTK